jgi:hypothetical protein
MTWFFRSSGRGIRPWLEARFLSLSIAAVACPFLVGPSGRDEAPTLQTAFAERALPVALPVASEAEPAAEPEPVTSALPDENGPQDQPPADSSTTEPGLIASHAVPSAAPTPDPEMDEVNQYLWSVYERTTIKRDGSGDFTWKDVAAAARLGVSLGDYVIGGMDRDFRELLYRAGLAMDAAGIRWTILSAFRDDYRQGMAAGYKAHTGDSLHGGSATVGGYGHGCAIDIVDADLKSRALWTWLAANGAQLGLDRPLAGLDPAHVQPRGPWHAVAAALRNDRLAKEAPEAAAAAGPPDLSAAAPTEADMMCVGLHHHRIFDPPQAIATPPEVTSFKAAARAHGLAKTPKGEKPKAGSRLAARAGSSGESSSAKPAQHSKASARSLARPAPHALPHPAGVT